MGGDVASLFNVAPHLGRGRSLEGAPGGERLRPSGYSPPCAKFAKRIIVIIIMIIMIMMIMMIIIMIIIIIIPGLRVAPNTVTYNAAISACARSELLYLP